MRLSELNPKFRKHPVKKNGSVYWLHAKTLAEASGIQFLCPVCFESNNGPIGTHSVVCWNKSVSLDWVPGPGRWDMTGTGFDDLTLTAEASSIQLTSEGGCQAHFYITNGNIKFT